jgi:hypothetical protein
MDRHSRMLASGCLAAIVGIVVSVTGCRSMRNDVPPGKPYSTTGGSPPAVGFNSDPHPNTSIGPGLYGNGLTPGAASTDTGPVGPGSSGPAAQLGTPTPGSSPFGMPPGNRYGSLPGAITPPPLSNQ